ncbi:MAG: hypothetical protein WCS65_11875 [Verrucomicrobiae bacterium]
MKSPHEGAAAADAAAPASAAKIRIAPRKANVAPAGKGEPQPPASTDHVRMGGGNRPNKPKIPFKQRSGKPFKKGKKKPLNLPLKPAADRGPGNRVPPEDRNRGVKARLLVFFTSRRKGNYRIVTYVLLPLAVLLTIALVFVILKIL